MQKDTHTHSVRRRDREGKQTFCRDAHLFRKKSHKVMTTCCCIEGQTRLQLPFKIFFLFKISFSFCPLSFLCLHLFRSLLEKTEDKNLFSVEAFHVCIQCQEHSSYTVSHSAFLLKASGINHGVCHQRHTSCKNKLSNPTESLALTLFTQSLAELNIF